jgi:putative protease
MRKPELAAPAGKPETFFAALDSGADAVYLGLKKFNARLGAENFTLPDLARLVPYAHERRKKVYVALNTLLKQTELPEAVSLLPALEKIGTDAVILADLGLAAAARARFPRLRLHLSTQAGVHSSAGTVAAERLGFARVILARELTRGELVLVRRRTAVELEVFVHGALCWSFSGFCLASSFIGGKSGNRGRCTQVCRRAFAAGGGESAYFSLRDLELLSEVPALTALGVDAFKIEGRLKGASSVRAVVSAYRRAIDDPASIAALKNEAVADFARPKTTYFYGRGERAKNEAVLGNETKSGAVGVFLGEVAGAGPAGVTVRAPASLEPGDSVRIQPASGFEGRRYKIASVRTRDDAVELVFHQPVAAAPGDRVYLVEKKGPSPGAPRALPAPRPWRPLPMEKARSLVDGLAPPASPPAGAVTYSLKIDSPDWLDAIGAAAPDAALIVLSLDLESGRRFRGTYPSLPDGLRTKIAVGFPFFISETHLDEYRRLAGDLAAAGVRRFWAESLGAFDLLKGKGIQAVRYWAAPSLGALNAQARVLLRSLGADIACYPLEDDFLNIRNSRRAPAAVIAYGLVPLFVSRADPGLPAGAELRDRNGNAFVTARRAGCSFLLGKEPVCLFQKRDKLEALGIRRFVLDLGFIPPDTGFLRDLLAAFRARKRLLPSTLFNFKRELA